MVVDAKVLDVLPAGLTLKMPARHSEGQFLNDEKYIVFNSATGVALQTSKASRVQHDVDVLNTHAARMGHEDRYAAVKTPEYLRRIQVREWDRAMGANCAGDSIDEDERGGQGR